MMVPNKRAPAAPALFRLLEESALSRAALGCCGVPVAIVDVALKSRSLSYANAAFEALFGYTTSEIAGLPLSRLFRGDDTLVHRILEVPRRWQVTAWAKDGHEHPVDLSVAGVRSVDGKLTHWVLAFADRREIEALREELRSAKSLADSSIALRVEDRRGERQETAHPDR